MLVLIKPYKLFTLLLMSILIAGCSEDDPVAPVIQEPEVITKLSMALTLLDSDNNLTTDVTSAVFEDVDGPGGANPTIETLSIPFGSFASAIRLFDESKNITDGYEFTFSMNGDFGDNIEFSIDDEGSSAHNLPLDFQHIINANPSTVYFGDSITVEVALSGGSVPTDTVLVLEGWTSLTRKCLYKYEEAVDLFVAFDCIDYSGILSGTLDVAIKPKKSSVAALVIQFPVILR